MSGKNPLEGRTEKDWTAKKAEINLCLRAAALIIKDNKLLAAKSADYDCYYVVGGGIEINETSEEAVVREVYEETGCKLEIDRLAFVQERFFTVDDQQFHEIGFFYLMKDSDKVNISDNSFTDLPSKTETLHWLRISDLCNINIVPKFLKTKSFDDITGIEHIILKE